MPSSKPNMENYDSAADSDIALDNEQEPPAAKKQKIAKKNPVTKDEIVERIKKGAQQKEKVQVKIKTIETRLMMAKTQEMKLDCETLRNEMLLKDMGI